MKINITVDFDRNARLKMARAYADRFEVEDVYMPDEECLKIKKPFTYKETKDWLLERIDEAIHSKISRDYGDLIDSYEEHQLHNGEPVDGQLIREFDHG